MKKLLYLFVFILIFGSISEVDAKTIKMVGQSMQDFSTKNPTKNISVKIIGDYALANGKYVPNGLVINGEVIKIREPKRGKLSAIAYFQLKNYTINGKNYTVKNPNAVGKITTYKSLDIKDKGIDLGVSAAGLLVENISYPINFVRGVATAEEGENRLKAGAELTYEKSMFSYLSKGKHIEVPAGEKLLVTFKYEVK